MADVSAFLKIRQQNKSMALCVLEGIENTHKLSRTFSGISGYGQRPKNVGGMDRATPITARIKRRD